MSAVVYVEGKTDRWSYSRLGKQGWRASLNAKRKLAE